MDAPLEDIQSSQKRLSTFLNVLTILTFIGCAYNVYQLVDGYFNSDEKRAQLEKGIATMEDGGREGFLMNISKYGLRMMDIFDQNKVIFLSTTFLGLALCVFGAIQMRRLRQMGFVIWLVGEYLPLVIWAVVAGSEFLNGFIAFQLIVPVAFTIMYASQRKTMTV